MEPHSGTTDNVRRPEAGRSLPVCYLFCKLERFGALRYWDRKGSILVWLCNWSGCVVLAASGLLGYGISNLSTNTEVASVLDLYCTDFDWEIRNPGNILNQHDSSCTKDLQWTTFKVKLINL